MQKIIDLLQKDARYRETLRPDWKPMGWGGGTQIFSYNTCICFARFKILNKAFLFIFFHFYLEGGGGQKI